MNSATSATAAAAWPGWRYVLAFLAAVLLLLANPLQAASGGKGCGKYGGGIGGTGLSRGYLNAVASGPAIPSAPTLRRSTGVSLDAKSRRDTVNFTGRETVMGQNLGLISGATVSVTWT